MVHAKTRNTVLKAFEDGVIDTPKGAFIGSFSIATIQLLFSSIASDVVPVSRRDELKEQFLLAEADALLPDAWVQTCLPFRKPGALPGVMEWRCPGLPSLFTLSTVCHSGASLRTNSGQVLACSVTGYRLCDPTQVRIWNGVVYRKAYRGWRPVRDLNHGPVCIDTLLSLASALGIEVERSIGWTFSRWLQAQISQHPRRSGRRLFRQEIRGESTHVAA